MASRQYFDQASPGAGGGAWGSNNTGARGSPPGGMFDYGGKLSSIVQFGSQLLPWVQAGSSMHNANKVIGIEEQNLTMQQGWMDYLKGIQKQIFEREDNSVQRRVADLKKAGLSPFLAAGQGAGAGAVVNSKAPQRGVQGYLSKIGVMNDFSGRMLDTQRTMAEIEAIKAQTNKTNVEADRVSGIAPLERQMMRANIQKALSSSQQMLHRMKMDVRNYAINAKRINSEIAVNQMQIVIAELDKRIKAPDAIQADYFVEMYAKVLLEEYGKSGAARNINPVYLELKAKQAMVYAQEHNLAIADLWQVPTGSTNMYQLLMGLTNLMSSEKYKDQYTQAFEKGEGPAGLQKIYDWAKDKPDWVKALLGM